LPPFVPNAAKEETEPNSTDAALNMNGRFGDLIGECHLT
jgi:hypothetical protein